MVTSKQTTATPRSKICTNELTVQGPKTPELKTTQPDPQSCRVRNLEGRRGEPKTNNASRDQNKLSSATPNRDKTIHYQRKHRKKHPAAMSQQNQHLTHAMLRKPATTTIELELATVSPESCHSVALARLLFANCPAEFRWFSKRCLKAWWNVARMKISVWKRKTFFRLHFWVTAEQPHRLLFAHWRAAWFQLQNAEFWFEEFKAGAKVNVETTELPVNTFFVSGASVVVGL